MGTINAKLQNISNSKAAIKTAIENKGISVGDAPLSQYADRITSIPSSGMVDENDVNFYDYDGYRVASYTIAQAKALTALPTCPSHPGLTFQEWNWTLADIQGWNRRYIDVGANYITTDGKTHIFIKVNDSSKTIKVTFSSYYGQLTINWGDNSSDTGPIRTSAGADTYTHTYSSGGDYEITLSYTQTANDGVYGPMNTHVSTSWSRNFVIKEWRLGSNVSLAYSYAICYFADEFKISIPTSTNCYFNRGLCNSCITQINMPRTFTDVLYQPFNFVRGRISLPAKMTNIANLTFNGAATGRIIFPNCTDSTKIMDAFALNALYTAGIISIPNLQFTTRTQADYISASYGMKEFEIVQGWTPGSSMRFNYNNIIEAEKIVEFFNKLGTTSTSITLTFGSTNLNKLTTDQKAIATGKGYTLA